MLTHGAGGLQLRLHLCHTKRVRTQLRRHHSRSAAHDRSLVGARCRRHQVGDRGELVVLRDVGRPRARLRLLRVAVDAGRDRIERLCACLDDRSAELRATTSTRHAHILIAAAQRAELKAIFARDKKQREVKGKSNVLTKSCCWICALRCCCCGVALLSCDKPFTPE